jgi:hypothetical protein
VSTVNKQKPATYKKNPNETGLSILVNNSGQNSPYIFSASNFVKENNADSEAELYSKMNSYLFDSGKKTIEEIATYCYENQDAIFDKAYKNPKCGLLIKDKYSKKDIYDYVKHLFITRSYRGFYMETLAEEQIKPQLPTDVRWWVDVNKLDVPYSVDFVVHIGSKIVLPVQVKPGTFKSMYDHQNKKTDNSKNKRFLEEHGHEVHYLWYDGENKWLNLGETIKMINNKYTATKAL